VDLNSRGDEAPQKWYSSTPVKTVIRKSQKQMGSDSPGRGTCVVPGNTTKTIKERERLWGLDLSGRVATSANGEGYLRSGKHKKTKWERRGALNAEGGGRDLNWNGGWVGKGRSRTAPKKSIKGVDRASLCVRP